MTLNIFDMLQICFLHYTHIYLMLFKLIILKCVDIVMKSVTIAAARRVSDNYSSLWTPRLKNQQQPHFCIDLSTNSIETAISRLVIFYHNTKICATYHWYYIIHISWLSAVSDNKILLPEETDIWIDNIIRTIEIVGSAKNLSSFFCSKLHRFLELQSLSCCGCRGMFCRW